MGTVVGLNKVTVTDNDLVSMENQHRLIYWLDTFRNGQFDIGDIAVQEIERNSKRDSPETHARVFKAVGRFCGKSGRTVRYYYENSLFYPKSVRKEFNMLPFSHFVFARYLGSTWRECLEWASLNPDCTEDKLRYEFTPPFRGCAENKNYQKEMEEIDFPAPALMRESGENAGTIIFESSQDNQREVNQEARIDSHFVLSVLNPFIGALEKVQDIVEKSKMNNLVKEEISTAISTLSNHLPKIVKELVSVNR